MGIPESGTQLAHLRRLTVAQVIVSAETLEKVNWQFGDYDYYTGPNPETQIINTSGLEADTLDALADRLNVPATTIEDRYVILQKG
ncbi:MAG: hypothetical protein AWU57_385 [Marinobacter sp. T13-3]|nr:MAG: hypothetical protein AWU57_385 [Marinobacter sp. T13-3]